MAYTSFKDFCIAANLATADQFDDWRKEYSSNGTAENESFFESVREKSKKPEKEFLSLVGEAFDWEIIDLSEVAPEKKVLSRIPSKVAFQHKVVPISVEEDGVLVVATSNPFSADLLNAVRFSADGPVRFALAASDEVTKSYEKYYGAGADTIDALSADYTAKDDGEEDDDFEKEIGKGNQAFWICPLIEESKKLDYSAAEQKYKFLSEKFKNKVGLIHGNLDKKVKNAVLNKFLNKSIDILVSTTVIEIGIDFPNANVIVIENSNKFGLSQLHQLRGRVGRGSKEGTCILTIEGGRHQILVCERVILNILGRLSGIATNTARWVANSQIPLAATRKTSWGVLDKAAVAIGGGLTHRIHRADALMLKENDLASTAEDGDVGAKRVRKVLRDIPLESVGAFVTVEVRTLDEALAAAEAWVERMLDDGEKIRLNIMLDNMGPELTRDAVLDIETRGLREYVTIEASGNITFEDLESWQISKVDLISTSALHRAAPPLDLTCIFEGV